MGTASPVWGRLRTSIHTERGPWAGLGSAPSDFPMGPWLPTQRGECSEGSPSPEQQVLGMHLTKDPPWALTVGSDPSWEASESPRGWASVSPFVTWCPEIPTWAAPHTWASRERVIS